MGCEHIRNLTHLPDVELVAVADPNPGPLEWARKACAEHFNPTFYSDYRALLEEPIDAVIIASPNFTHIDVMRDVFDTDLHVLLEKPMGTTLADCREMVARSDARNAMVWVALEYRYMSAISRFLRELPIIGDLKSFFIREHRQPFLKKVDDWNRFNRTSGGTLVEKCCHFFDLMTLAIGATPVSVYASGGQDVNHLDEVYNGEVSDIIDNAYVVIDYDNGSRACLDLCMFAEGSFNEQELVAIGSAGKLEVHIPENRLSISPRQDQARSSSIIETDPRIQYMGLHHGASYLEQLDFCDAIRNDSPPKVTTRDGFLSVAIGIAAQDSILNKTPVRIESAPIESAPIESL
jgi:myo-inositol 2-dehydrogenase/D-chiro-inositol 1-dehydrogenase